MSNGRDGGGGGRSGGGGGGRSGGPRKGPGGFGRFARAKRVAQPEEPLDYKSVDYLMKFVTAVGKIHSRRRTGFSGQNQRKLGIAIKRARFLGLLPYVGRS